MDRNIDHSISNEYHSEEFPVGYRRFLINDFATHDRFTNECLQKIYQSGRISGTRLLDFGCGPTVHRIASATRQFNDITLSEWSESNRKAVEKWLRGDKDALDWTPILERFAAAEGYRDLDFGVAEIERRIRKSVKKVVPCDVLATDILPEGLGEFDVINSCYCLECGCPNIEVYKDVLKKLVKYLKKGGAFVMVVALEAKQYTAHKMLPALYLTEATIKDALTGAGLDLRDWFSWMNVEKCSGADYGGMAVFYSIKS